MGEKSFTFLIKKALGMEDSLAVYRERKLSRVLVRAIRELNHEKVSAILPKLTEHEQDVSPTLVGLQKSEEFLSLLGFT